MSEEIPRHQADRSILQQIIGGLSEGIMLINPDGQIGWVNDTLLAMFGAETIEALGGTADGFREKFILRYRNNHRLEPAEYPIDRVMNGDEFTEMVFEIAEAGSEQFNRVNRARGMVVTNATGERDCLAVIFHDETARYAAEQRFERTFNANPAPAVIARLDDLRYVKVNQGFLDMTGYEKEQVLGRSVYEVDVLEAAENRPLAIERLGEGRTIPQMEARLSLPGGGGKSVVLAGQPIDIAEDPCMLFTFMDLEPRKQAEASLRQSEARFAASFRLTPVPTMLCALDDFTIIDINEAFAATFGEERADFIGQAVAQTKLWNDATVRRNFETAINKAGSVRNMDAALTSKTGDVIDCLISAERITIGEADRVLWVAQDITERKRSEEDLVTAIETVMQDTSWFSRTVIEKLATLRRPGNMKKSGPTSADLTLRERQTLELIAAGLRDAEIAKKLGVSPNTIRNYVASVYAKIDAHSRGEAIVWARERGLVAKG
jgi:PAS domain S-box-containing protein